MLLICFSENIEDMIFERTQSSKIRSCRIPFHIVWHNFVSSAKELQEKILLYEPLQVEDLYTRIKNLGFKFHIQVSSIQVINITWCTYIN